MRHKSPRNPTSVGTDIPVVRHFKRNFRWTGVELEPYKIATHLGGEFSGASRQVLVGKRGERVKFHLRYFELERGGFTSLEQHHHSHVVVGARGRGRVRVGDKQFRINPMDTIYIGPDQAHQLCALGAASFGFFCIVDAKRDRPRAVQAGKRSASGSNTRSTPVR